jgi:3-oxoacyl-[acyl-carrier protein] reductase
VSIIQASRSTASFAAMDVRSTERIDEVIAAVNAERGAINVLVLNAGVAHKVPLEALDDTRWDYTLDIDLKGMFRVARTALPTIRRRRSGSVVCLTIADGTGLGLARTRALLGGQVWRHRADAWSR